MKKILTLFLLAGTAGFSQRVDSLSIDYGIGYKATRAVNGKDIRGIYEKEQEMTYEKKKHSYKIDSFVSIETFREWGQANLFPDSLKTPHAFMRRKLPGKKLDEFLVAIVSMQKDSIFSYKMKDVPRSFLKEHSLTRASDKDQVDSLIRSKLNRMVVSNVTGRLFIHFHYRGVSYDLVKDSNNEDWRIYIAESDEGLHFIHFEFDAFLLNELPKKFSGRKVLD